MNITIYTDGSNVHNGKPHSYGGYGYVIQLPDDELIEGGCSLPVNGTYPVTNNRAELLALIESITYLIEHDDYQSYDYNILVKSDSQWVVRCANKEWKRKTNPDLWNRWNKLEFFLKMKRIKYSIEWVKGHAGIELNEMADQLAGMYKDQAKNMDPV